MPEDAEKKVEAMQVWGPFSRRLGRFVGSPVTLFLLGVTTGLLFGGGRYGYPYGGWPGVYAAGGESDQAGVEAKDAEAAGTQYEQYPYYGTTVLRGTVAGVGDDYVEMNVPVQGGYRPVVIPMWAVGGMTPG